jgi:hypothetical protein
MRALTQFEQYLNIEFDRLAKPEMVAQLEQELSTDAEKSYLYALYRGEAFPLGELAIASDLKYAALYSKNILKSYFDGVTEQLENVPPEQLYGYFYDSGNYALPESIAIRIAELNKPSRCYYYSYYTGVKFEEFEQVISSSSKYSVYYAQHVLKNRFKLGEVTIANDPSYARMYAEDVLHGPFVLGEAAIATSAYESHRYTLDVLKRRFILGEPTMAQDDSWYRDEYSRLIWEIRSSWNPYFLFRKIKQWMLK